MSNNDITILLNRLAGVYRDPSRITRDSSSLLRCSLGQNLRPSISMLTLNDGAYHPSVLVFQGTIAMTYRNKKYNIPIDIYLPPQYPVRPPVSFVRPVENMVIKENHRNVGTDGMVYMPYLHTWNQSNHTLIDMVSSMSLLFGTDPPLFSRRANSTQQQTSNNNNNNNNTSARPQQPPRYEDLNYQKQAEAEAIAIAESQQQEVERQQRLKEEKESALVLEMSRREEEARIEKQKQEELHQKEEERLIAQKLKKDVTQKLQDHLAVFFQESRNRITSDLKDQTVLSDTEKKIASQVKHLQQLKTDITTRCTHVDEQTQLLQSKLETKPTGPIEEPKVDDLVQPSDLHSKQMLNLSAENAAISDGLYFLDKALSKGNIPLNVHLKKTRELAKRQFFVRAHCMKIAHFKSMDVEGLHGSLGASVVSL